MQVTFIFAFVAVLALMLLAAWLVRRFANSRIGANDRVWSERVCQV